MADTFADRPNELSATEMARRIAAGDTTSEAVVRACLDRIREREDTVHAWAFIDPELAMIRARERDAGPVLGPLHGVPVGVKDIIDTFDMPTGMGSPIYEGCRPVSDASCVALMRAAGAVILGKTVTAEFAGMEPGETANPHNPTHTPGGSSSGSAAGVADFMVPAAFGTQTGGSVIRPSSYCGVIGYKPSFDTFNLGGVKPAAQSLDTLGLHARTLDDIDLLTAVLVNRPPAPPQSPASPPAIGLCRTPIWDDAHSETRDAIEDAASRLSAAGASLRDVALPTEFGWLGAARDTINSYERARLMAHEWAQDRARISEQLRTSIQRGLDMPYAEYVAAIRLMEECRPRLAQAFDGLDALLTPAVDGEAPEGLGYTGNPRFQGMWTMMHVPTLSLPTHTGPSGLPVGIQLVGRHRQDDALFATARWVLDALGTWREE